MAPSVLSLLLLALACAAPRPAVPEPADGAARPVAEDARPGFHDETEVDVVAHPVAAIRPAYPAELRALGVEGDVEARVAVRADGTFGGARLLGSSHPAFTAAAREALRGAHFHPARRDGRAVPSWVTVRLRFRLDASPR